MKKARLNYGVDVVIGVAFLGSALSGLVFLIPPGWLPLPTSGLPTVLGLNFWVWDTLHTYSSLLLIAGVGLHLVLHWAWIWAMTARLLPQRRTVAGREAAPELTQPGARWKGSHPGV